MNKIFINDTTVEFSPEQPIEEVFSIHFSDFTTSSPDDFINKAMKGAYGKKVVIWGRSSAEVLNYFSDHLLVIIAAGGLVQNPKDEVLFIYRRNLWDLPKGKPENDETIEETAIREVEEECGISRLKILAPLPSTYHIYPMTQGGYILKKCVWFHMRSHKWKNVKLQTEESITDARWVPMPFPEIILNGAFPSIRALVNYFQTHHQGS